jgi:hypothetical protein
MNDLIPEPIWRNLRIFAFDPSLSAQFDTAGIGEITIAVPWEKDLQPGPVGEYLEVIDADPAPKSYLIHEAEVPRTGIRITQTFQRARWKNGRVVLWLGQRKQVGRGEASSGLEFDQIREPSPRRPGT